LYIVNLKALKVQCLVYPCIDQVVEVDLIISKPIHSRDRNYSNYSAEDVISSS